ncbi:MAG: hypothetical protein AAFX93_19635 [Verrucomicrobiota bacterium]
MKIVYTSIFLVLLLVGCVNSDSIQFGEARPPKPADYPIDVYPAPELIDRQFDIVGEASADIGQWTDDQEAIDALKSEAREMGGDAIVLAGKESIGRGFSTQSPGYGPYAPKDSQYYYSSNARELTRALVIVYK